MGMDYLLLLIKGVQDSGFEIKHTAAPAMTRSAHIAIEALKLQRLGVIHAGDHSLALAKRARRR
jgi:hypothetical protein